VLRQTNSDLRRPAGPLLDASLTAAVVAAVFGAAIDRVDLVPDWPAHGWLVLLALSSQVVGWLLISVSLPRLPAALTSVLLLIQPVASVALAALILGESPSALQVTGVVVILFGVVYATTSRRTPVPATA
jgi:drug/metabolite transporter (DMT)-like permease